MTHPKDESSRSNEDMGTRWVYLHRLARDLAAVRVDTRIEGIGDDLTLLVLDPATGRRAVAVACVPTNIRTEGGAWLYLWTHGGEHPADAPKEAAASIAATVETLAERRAHPEVRP